MLSVQKTTSLVRPYIKRNVPLARSMTILSKESKEEHKKEVRMEKNSLSSSLIDNIERIILGYVICAKISLFFPWLHVLHDDRAFELLKNRLKTIFSNC